MILEPLFQLIGQSLTIIIIILLIIFILALVLGRILIKRDILIFPSLIIFVIDVFYSPLKSVSKRLGFDETLVDHMGVEVRNKVNKKKFLSIPPEKKIIVMPHCLRVADCQATLKESGMICTCCNKCAIGVIKSKAEPMGYKTFIVPGSSFIKKIIKKNEFEGVVGIACYEDLNQMMMSLSDFAPQGVLLSRSGCYETKVDIKSVLETIGYYDEKKRLKEERKNNHSK